MILKSVLQYVGIAWRRRIATKALRERCEAKLRELPIPTPCDGHTFCEALAGHRGRPIALRPLPLRAMTGRGTLYGLLVSDPSGDTIYYERDTSQLHQQQIIAHEAGHLILGHPSAPVDPDELTPLPDEILEGVHVVHLHRRDGTSTMEEEEAETLATLILKRAAALHLAAQVLEPQLIEALTRLEPFYDADTARLHR
jgi:hypothetical protein